MAIINDYVDWCEQRRGSIYERDEITSLISDLIFRLKTNCENKPVVLVVDDLDRLDPEHVFRLFNVFSAHYDATTDFNKFGLDKVIFVCDYYNIALMYRHRYGDGVDFDGYINKFFSLNVFHFETAQHLNESIEKILLTRPSNISPALSQRYTPFDRRNIIFNTLILLLSDLIRSNHITFRNIDQFKEFFVPQYQIKIDEQFIYANQLFFVTFVVLLKQAISIDTLIDALNSMAEGSVPCTASEYNEKNLNYYPWLVDLSLVCFLNGRQLNGYSNDKTIQLEIGGENHTINLSYSFDSGMVNPKLDVSENKKFNAYRILAEAIKAGQKRNIFR